MPRGSIIVDVGGGIELTSMLLANAFARPGDDQDLGFRFIVQDRPIVVELGEKVSYFMPRNAWILITGPRHGGPSIQSCWTLEQRTSKVNTFNVPLSKHIELIKVPSP